MTDGLGEVPFIPRGVSLVDTDGWPPDVNPVALQCLSCDMVPADTIALQLVIPADTDALVPAATPVADSARGSEQAKHQREVAVAELVLGEDLDILGGTAPIANFQQLANTDTCGKMAALEKLLALWHGAGGNKVQLNGRGCL